MAKLYYMEEWWMSSEQHWNGQPHTWRHSAIWSEKYINGMSYIRRRGVLIDKHDRVPTIDRNLKRCWQRYSNNNMAYTDCTVVSSSWSYTDMFGFNSRMFLSYFCVARWQTCKRMSYYISRATYLKHSCRRIIHDWVPYGINVTWAGSNDNNTACPLSLESY